MFVDGNKHGHVGAEPAWGHGAQAPLPPRVPLEAKRKEEEEERGERRKKREKEEGASLGAGAGSATVDMVVRAC